MSPDERMEHLMANDNDAAAKALAAFRGTIERSAFRLATMPEADRDQQPEARTNQSAARARKK